jgi:hypothetical protein
MPFKLKMPKFKPLKALTGVLKERRRKIAKDNHKAALDALLVNFDTYIPIEVVDITLPNGDFSVEIRPVDGIETTNRASNQPITTKQLFEWLNDGTTSNYAVMPDDFKNKSFANSLETRRQNYAKHRIFLKKTSERGIDARNWIQLINERYAAEDVYQIEKTITNWLNNWTKD